MHTIYQAGPLFSEAERDWHKKLTLRLEKAGHTVVWPGDLLTADQIEAAGANGPLLIYNACRKALDRCSAVAALLDGPQVDDGTAWEIGYAVAKGLPVFGIRTDYRQGGDTPHSFANSMIEACLKGVARNAAELVELLGRNKRDLGPLTLECHTPEGTQC